MFALAVPGSSAEAATRRKPRATRAVAGNYSVSIPDDAKTVTAGGSVDYDVVINTNRSFRGVVVFELPNISDFLTARIVPGAANHATLHINVPPNVPGHSGVFILRGRSGNLARDALFRLTVNPAPTTTVTTTTVPPNTPTTAAPQFGVIADQSTRTATAGQTVQYGITVDRRAGFSGPVSFQAQNLPPGATANFAPNPTTASTVFYVTPGTSTPSGTYLITALATAGSTTRAAAMQLIVRRTGEFGLALAPSAVTTGAGNDAVAAVNVSAPRGSSAPAPDVDFAVQGLPNGVSAIFTPNPSNGIAQLRLTTLPAAAPGTYTVSIVGTSGSVRHAVPLRLTVQRNVPSFGFQAQPTTQTVAPGAVATYTISVARAGGFNGAIALAFRGLPPESSPTVQATNDTITVRIATSEKTPTGTYHLEFTGTSGQLQATVKVDLVVKA